MKIRSRSLVRSMLQTPSGVVATALFAVACGDPPPPVSNAPPAEALPISGIYLVTGTTVDLKSGARREIDGTIVLDQDGAAYTATFDLDTLFPTGQGSLEAEVIGQGSGSVDGRTLIGTAQTQIVVSTVPGVDPRFAFVPRTTTTRIVSESTTTIAPDGSVEIQIESKPDEGETYSPTRTTLKGTRVSDRPVGDG